MQGLQIILIFFTNLLRGDELLIVIFMHYYHSLNALTEFSALINLLPPPPLEVTISPILFKKASLQYSVVVEIMCYSIY